MLITGAGFQYGCQQQEDFSGQLPGDDLKKATASTFYGPAIPMGNGVARAWISVNSDQEPTAIGVNMSAKALENLPEEMAAFSLKLPVPVKEPFYTHLLVDWNPHGHEPPGVYDLPHFDFHFYTIPEEERLAIAPDDAAGFANMPAEMYRPPLYMQIPGGVPQMGAHWIDLLSPEIHGEVFTKTFIWGSFDGSFIFWEPMITLDYLLSQPDDLIPLRLPAAFERDGWYAHSYSVSYSENPGTYTVALGKSDFSSGGVV